MNDRELVAFLQWALPRLGLKWSGFRKVRGTLRERIGRRLEKLGLDDLSAYRRVLEAGPDEWPRLDALCRIPISRFFRDRGLYDVLGGHVLPLLADEAAADGRTTVRVLSAGCASGEEPYSVALAWTLAAGPAHPAMCPDILAVDADATMLERARNACYRPGSLREVPEAIVARSFQPVDGLLCLRHDVRRHVRLAPCNLEEDLPPGPFDLVLCRNVAFTYFDDDRQRACLGRLRAAVREGGYLVVGSHERLPDGAAGFDQFDPRLPIYRRDPPAPTAPRRHGSGGEMLVIDGAQGEGGGQIVRTAVSLSALTGRPVRIDNMRARRKVPGLVAQHVTAVRAAASLCDAAVTGDAIGSRTITFTPRQPAAAGDYRFDVADARPGGSAGSTTLVLQTVLLPLAFAPGPSTLVVEGGTHLRWSPSFDFIRSSWLPLLWRLGIEADVSLDAWGWYPAGGGAVTCRIRGHAAAAAVGLAPLDQIEPGPLEGVTGRAVAARLPCHIAERMRTFASDRLAEQGIASHIDAEAVESVSPGAGIFLTALYRGIRCGFTAVGERGLPAEKVAAAAVGDLLAHRASGTALDRHLADQILLPLAFASAPSRFSVERITAHIETNAQVIERFGIAEIGLAVADCGTGVVSVTPRRT